MLSLCFLSLFSCQGSVFEAGGILPAQPKPVKALETANIRNLFAPISDRQTDKSYTLVSDEKPSLQLLAICLYWGEIISLRAKLYSGLAGCQGQN